MRWTGRPRLRTAAVTAATLLGLCGGAHRPRRPGRRAGGGPAHRPGQPVHRHPERGQHLSRRRRALRHGPAVAGHRPQHRLRLRRRTTSAASRSCICPVSAAASAATCRSLPTTGDVTETDDAKYAAGFNHDDEKASPGYYKVGLKGGDTVIDAELTATARTGVQRYTFPATDKANVLLEHRPGAAQDGLHDGRDPRRPHRTHRDHRQRLLPGHPAVHGLHAHPLRPAVHHVRAPGRATRSPRAPRARPAPAATAPTSASTPRRTARSRRPPRCRTSTRAARPSTSAAEGGRSFDSVRDAARRAWQDRLDDVRVQGGSDRHRRTFYSSLYRSFLAPEHRQRRRRPLHRLGREGPPREGLHVLPELVPVGHLPHPGAAPRPAGAARVAGHGALRPEDRRAERLAAQVGLRHGRDEHHDRRPGHPVPHQRLPAGPAQGATRRRPTGR